MSETNIETSSRNDSLISIGLRIASTIPQSRIPMVKLQDLNPEVTRGKRITTISVHEVATPQPVLELGTPLLPNPKPRLIQQDDTNLTTRQKWGFGDPKNTLSKPVLSTMSEHTTVHKGFGRFMIKREPVVFEERVPFFPPLPNAAYNFVNKGIEPRRAPAIKPLFDGAAFVKNYLLNKNAEDEAAIGSELTNLAEQTAEHIDWTHKLYSDGEMCVQSMHDFCIAFWRNDLVTAIKDAPILGQEPFEMCNKCHKRHIAWGPPRAMHDRDTCLSKLPVWFPAEEFDEPWNEYIKLINKMVEFEEIEQGRQLDPNRMVWDKSFHLKSDEWILPGRVNGGWWKCRTGNEEGETDVPILERRCRLCHRERTKEEETIEANSKVNAAEKIRIRTWIERCIKIQMMKDRAIVEARIRHGLE